MVTTYGSERSFAPQDKVYVRKAGSKSPWVPGTIVARNGNVHYEVILDDQRSVRRHIDHIQPRTLSLRGGKVHSQGVEIEFVNVCI